MTGPCHGGSVVGRSPEPAGPVSTFFLGGVRTELLDTLLVLENWLVFSKVHTFGIRKRTHRSEPSPDSGRVFGHW